MSKLYFLLFLLFFSNCSFLEKINQKKEPPKQVIIVELGIQLSSPVAYNNYSYKEIQNNIDNSATIINYYNKELAKNNVPERRAEIDTKKKKTEDVKKAWKDAGHYSSEFRESNNDISNTAELTAGDFEIFLDVNRGDLLGKITKIFGTPQVSPCGLARR